MRKRTKNLFIIGTDTGVGKTVVTAAIAGILIEKGYCPGIIKPVQTGCLSQPNLEYKNFNIGPDLEFLRKAVTLFSNKGKKTVLPDAVYSFEPPVSPDLAARLAGETIDPAKILKAYKQISAESDIVLVEGIGGLMVPLKDDYLIRDLIVDMDIPLIIVARPGLGTLNQTLLTIEIARKSGLEVEGVVINWLKKDEAGLSEEHNPETIARVGQVKILGILPFMPDVDVDSCRLDNPEQFLKTAESCLDLDFLK
ncbi:MAG: dethiobiotin synthase [Candidatus Omnitrophica bacterium]|nr:dethiobiotin synthase [Candidatus Omnitrophota bacterium]